MNSERFPGKILKKIHKLTILDLIYLRLNRVKYPKEIVFLIPDNKKNVQLKAFMKKRNFKFFLGDEKNVLKRFFLAAKTLRSDHIIRITADCPFIDPRLLDDMIKKYFKTRCDFLSNVYPKATYPDGLDAEIFNFKSLAKAYLNANTSYQREHVTPYMQKNKNLKLFNFKNNKDLSNLRITLDYKKDLIFLNKIFKKLKYNDKFSLNDIIKLNKKNSEFFNYG